MTEGALNTHASRILISYSHRRDGLAWKDRLLAQLAVFEKHHVLDTWHDVCFCPTASNSLLAKFLSDSANVVLRVARETIGLERWLSGLKRRFAKPVKEQSFRGFESLSLRQFSLYTNRIRNNLHFIVFS